MNYLILSKMGSHEKSITGKEFSSSIPTNSLSLPMKITVLVVDDDATSLAIVSAMLREWSYEVEMASSPMEALAALRARPGDIDLVVTDLHMPVMNGTELQKQINREFKQLPVIIMSSDDQESVMLRSLAGGAVFFMVKPVNPEDLKNVWQYAIAAKKGKAVHVEDSTGSIEQGESSSTGKLSRSQRKSATAVNDHDEKNDNSKRGTKRKASRKGKDDDDDEIASAPKKAKVVWTNTLHNQFLEALRHIGMDKAVPKKILEQMNVPGLTRENVASHLQKYRMFLKRVAERGCFSSKAFVERVLKSSFASGHPTLLKTAQEYSQMAELQRMRGLTFHPGYGGTTVPARLNSASHRSILFPNYNNMASSSNSARQHHGYGQSRLLGNQAANYNNRRSVSGNPNHLYQGNRLGFANGSNLSSLNGGFSGGLINARNGLMNGANPMQAYQHQIQARPNFYNDAGASSSQFTFGSSGFHSSNSNLGTRNMGTISTSYPTLNSSFTDNISYPAARLPADGLLFGMGQIRLNNGGYGSVNGPSNENGNVAAMAGNQTFHHMAQGAGSSSQGSYGPNQASPAYSAANKQSNTSILPGLGNNGGAIHYNSADLMNNGGATHYNTAHPMNHASTFDNVTPSQQFGDGYLNDLLLESRNHQFSNQLQAGGVGVQNPDFPGSPLFPEIYPSLEDLLNIDFAESLSLEETSPRARRKQALAQIQSVNEEVTEMDTGVGGGTHPSDVYYPTTNFNRSTNQQQSGEQLADHSELSDIFRVNNASASASGNEPSNNQNWGDDFVNSLFSFDPHFE